MVNKIIAGIIVAVVGVAAIEYFRQKIGPITLSVKADSASILAGGSVTFTATATGGVAPYSYAWNFGNGNTGNGNPVSETFISNGTFKTTCTVTDSAGNVASGSDTVTVTSVATPFLTASSPTFAEEGTTVQISGLLYEGSPSTGGIGGESVEFLVLAPGAPAPVGIGSATTNGTGLATISYTIPSGGPPGTWTFYSSFGGDAAKGLTAAANATSNTTVYAPLSVTVGP